MLTFYFRTVVRNRGPRLLRWRQ